MQKSMNYKLSTYANRVSKKNCFTLESGGKTVNSLVFRFIGDNIKQNALETIYRGLKTVGQVVKHNDVVIVEVQNQHLCNWLLGYQEYQGYNEKLDKVFEVLEGIDCRYKFVTEKKPYAKVFGDRNGLTKMSFSTLDDFMSSAE